MTDEPDIAFELAYVAEHPAMFTKMETATMLAAAKVIEDLRTLVGIREEIGLEDIAPKGNA